MKRKKTKEEKTHVCMLCVLKRNRKVLKLSRALFFNSRAWRKGNGMIINETGTAVHRVLEKN